MDYRESSQITPRLLCDIVAAKDQPLRRHVSELCLQRELSAKMRIREQGLSRLLEKK